MDGKLHLKLVPVEERHVLSGATMGTYWSAVFYAPKSVDLAEIASALQTAVDAVDDQMSPWKPDSLVSRFNAAPDGTWFDLPPESFEVISEAISLNGATEGLFDPFVGGAVKAWGFGCTGGDPDPEAIAFEQKQAREGGRAIRFDRGMRLLSRRGNAVLDLCGIAKGYGVDRLSEVLSARGICRHLVAIDGEVCAEGMPQTGRGWTVAIERPDENRRDAALALELSDMAIATSGSYRHVREIDGKKLSHTIDPRTGAPSDTRLSSVTVLSDTAMTADGLATGLMVMGMDRGLGFATRHGIAALFIVANADGAQRLAPSPRFSELTGIGGTESIAAR